MIKETTKGLLGVTVAGATEGAIIGTFIPPVQGPIGAVSGGVIGGTTAFGLELYRRAFIHSAKEPAPVQMPGMNGSVDVTVETTSTTKRIDAPEEESEAIVKSNVEQATSVAMRDLPSALASMRERTRANVFPQWHTTLNEKTVATALDAAEYKHTPQRIG